MFHSVSAFDTESGLVLGHVATEQKSNEITAIPQLLDAINIKDSIITIDAMGCQKKITQKIRAKSADYILALKKNHGELYNSVESYFSSIVSLHDTNDLRVHHKIDKGHGRIEIRSCLAVPKEALWGDSKQWKYFTTLIIVDATGESDRKKTTTRRYYISSIAPDSAFAHYAVRKLWCIENQLHWVLDVTFKEDYSRARTKFLQKNLSTLRKIAINILKLDNRKKMTIKRRRFAAAMDPQYIIELFTQYSVLET